MNRPVGVCITQNSRNPRISSACKLYAYYYFYIVVLSVSVCQKTKNNVQIIKRKYIMTNIDTQETYYSVYSWKGSAIGQTSAWVPWFFSICTWYKHLLTIYRYETCLDFERPHVHWQYTGIKPALTLKDHHIYWQYTGMKHALTLWATTFTDNILVWNLPWLWETTIFTDNILVWNLPWLWETTIFTDNILVWNLPWFWETTIFTDNILVWNLPW
jgi:hypothetical protein